MSEDLLYNTDILNTLFTEKDFCFISSCSSEIEKLDAQIHEQEIKREVLVQFLNNTSDFSNKDLNDKAQIIFSEVNNNINLLYDLKKNLNDINQNTVKLLVSAESKKMSDDYYKADAKAIQSTIGLYTSLLEETNHRINFQNRKVDKFIKDNIDTEYKPSNNIYSINPISDLSNTTTSNKFFIDASSISSSEHSNKTLLISEKQSKVFLPYYETEVNRYLEQFPNQYSSFDDVVNNEFVVPINYFLHHTVLSRFRETYSLIRDRESKSIFEAMRYSFDLMFKYDLNPAIIAACKTQNQLENYINCLDSKKLNEFTDFEIKYEVFPLNTPNTTLL